MGAILDVSVTDARGRNIKSLGNRKVIIWGKADSEAWAGILEAGVISHAAESAGADGPWPPLSAATVRRYGVGAVGAVSHARRTGHMLASLQGTVGKRSAKVGPARGLAAKKAFFFQRGNDKTRNQPARNLFGYTEDLRAEIIASARDRIKTNVRKRGSGSALTSAAGLGAALDESAGDGTAL